MIGFVLGFSSFCPTSKMSHDHSRRGSCSFRLMIRLVHSIILSLAGAVTGVGVGSGAWFGVLASDLRMRKMDMEIGVWGATLGCYAFESMSRDNAFASTIGVGQRRLPLE